MWNAGSEQELLNRPLTPYSPAVATRLDEYRHAFRNGEERFESWTVFPKGVATSTRCRFTGVAVEGHPEAMLVEVQSFTGFNIPPEETRALEALRHTPLMITLFSQSGDVLMRNPAALAKFGDLDRSLPAGADHFRAMFASAADYEALLAGAVQNVPQRRDAIMALPGGPMHTVHATLVADPVTGQAAHLVAQEDISDFIEVNRQLAASEDALDAVLAINLAPVIVLSVSDNKVLKANLSARERLGMDLIGTSAENLFLRAGDWQCLRETILSGRGSSASAHLKSAEGASFWASLSGIRISFDKQDALAIMVADIDSLYRTAADLETALSLERTTGATQRRFLAIASHEFRTPLALIDSVAQRLARGAETMSPDQVRGRAQRIRATVQRLILLLERIVDRARDNRAALGYVAVEADLGTCISRVVEDFRENHADVEVHLSLPPMPLLRMDTALMEQVIHNLLSNAQKYSADPACVDITGAVTSDDVQIFITDNGIGIPPEERSRVFADYVRGSNVESRPGTGLGLAIVGQIISLHGGMIEVVDRDGPGTTMKITLPRP